MRARTNKALRSLHLLLDAVALVAAIALAEPTHATLRLIFPQLEPLPAFHEYALLAQLALPLWLSLIVVLGLHRSFERVWTAGALLLRVLQLQALGLLGLSLVHFLAQADDQRGFVASFLLCSFTLLYGLWLLLDRRVRSQHARGVTQRRVLVVGDASRRMASFVHAARSHALPPHLLGYLSAPDKQDGLSMPPQSFEPLTHLGVLSTERLSALLHDEAIDEVLFFPPLNRTELLAEYIAVCEELGVHASVSVDLVQIARAAPQLSSLYQHPFVTFDVAPKRPELLAIKHGLDSVLAFVLLLAALPVLAIVSLAIWVSMGRPIFFAQPRAGLYGRPFSMFKFRSMVRGAELERPEWTDPHSASQAVLKAKDDPRITPLGRILRKTSLDELPQLVNVLLGSMSLVGPRPLPLDQHRWLRDWQRRRLSMKPGITGVWQVSGRSDLDFDQWMELDLQYIDEWSLVLDLRILLRTLPVVFSGRGAH